MSKGLEAFEEIKTVMTKLFGGVERCDKALAIVEKELKALEIIKNNMFEFIFIDITKRIIVCFGETSWTYYCEAQETYDLLKEILCQDKD